MILIDWAPLVNHVWQSTVLIGVAALVAQALRNNSARVRYWVWFAASLKFLVPFSALVSIGSLAWPTRSAMFAAATISRRRFTWPSRRCSGGIRSCGGSARD